MYDYIIAYYMLCAYMWYSIICVTYIPRLLIEYIILYVRIYAIYSPPCIIDGVVYVYYYMCVLYTKKTIAIYALLLAHIAIYRPT